jgi:hypothetical protein
MKAYFSSAHTTRAFPITWFPGFKAITSSFTHVSITFSNQSVTNCSKAESTVDAGFVKLMLQRLCGNWAFRMNRVFRSVATWTPAVLKSFETSLSQCTTISFCQCRFRPPFPFAVVAIPRFVYAGITLDTVALNRSRNVAVLSQMLQLNAHQRYALFQIGEVY